MGSIKNQAFTSRKATFKTSDKSDKTILYAVNKRAHTVVKKAGHRSKISLSELALLNGTGSYTFHVWVNGVLKPISL